MKINEPLASFWAKETRRTDLPQGQQDFERLLDHSSKNSSGDEYYWQHQNQLQQSSLHFELKPATQQQKPQATSQANTAPDRQNRVAPSEGKTSQPKAELQAPKTDKPQNNKPLLPLSSTPPCSKSKNASNPAVVAATSMKPQPQCVDKFINTVKANTSQVDPGREFKKHHLFVEGEHAELSMNVDDLKEQEQKIVRQLIKNQFKNKGLILKKLTMNGVNHE